MEVIYQLKKVSVKHWNIVTDEGVLFYSGKTRSEAIVKLFSNMDMEEGTLILVDEANKLIKSRLYRPKKVDLGRSEFLYQRSMMVKQRNALKKVA